MAPRKVRHQLREDAPVQPQQRQRGLDMRHRQSDRRWLTSAEAVEHLGLGSLNALYWHIKENRLPYGRIGGRYRFQVAALDAWVDRLSAAALQKVS